MLGLWACGWVAAARLWTGNHTRCAPGCPHSRLGESCPTRVAPTCTAGSPKASISSAPTFQRLSSGCGQEGRYGARHVSWSGTAGSSSSSWQARLAGPGALESPPLPALVVHAWLLPLLPTAAIYTCPPPHAAHHRHACLPTAPCCPPLPRTPACQPLLPTCSSPSWSALAAPLTLTTNASTTTLLLQPGGGAAREAARDGAGKGHCAAFRTGLNLAAGE